MRTVLLPTDLSVSSRNVVDSGLSFLLRVGGVRKIILLHTYTLPNTLPDSPPHRLVEIHDDLKKRSLQGLEEELLRIQTKTETDGILWETRSFLGTIENVLAYLVRESEVDCVVLGLEHDKKVSKETLRILQRLTCPALVMPDIAACQSPG